VQETFGQVPDLVAKLGEAEEETQWRRTALTLAGLADLPLEQRMEAKELLDSGAYASWYAPLLEKVGSVEEVDILLRHTRASFKVPATSIAAHGQAFVQKVERGQRKETGGWTGR